MTLGIVFMASGFGRRFGSNKLLYSLNGRPLYAHGLSSLIEAAGELKKEHAVNIAVVSRYAEILAEAEKSGAVAVYNAESGRGITASIKLGISNLPRSDFYAFFVADQPYFKSETTANFFRKFLKSGKTIACVTDRAALGNPVIFSRIHMQELLSLEGDSGGKQIVKWHPEDVFYYPVDSQELFDLDTPEDVVTALSAPKQTKQVPEIYLGGTAMQKLFSEMKNRLENNEDLVLVTVVASSGAAPRGAGARMLVGLGGRICGTVGGGAVEFRSIQLAQNAINERTSAVRQFILDKNQIEDIGMVCGGNVTIFFRYFSGGSSDIIGLCETALAQFQEQKTTLLITELTDGFEGEIGLYSEKLGLFGDITPTLMDEISVRTGIFEHGGKKYYAEKILSSGFVYIFGGGHVAQELVPVLAHLDFRCIVLDDRPEFVSAELFPAAAEIRLVDFEEIYEMKQVTGDDYIIIMTRGHRSDQAIEEQALKTPAKYIGVIGSRRKIAQVEKNIMEHGFTRADLDRVTAPIGLMAIKAETPAEIAISIAGQLIAFRAGAGILT